MSIWALLSSFSKDDQAAITVDWVVLTAALVTMGIAVAATIQSGLETSATTISDGIILTVADALS